MLCSYHIHECVMLSTGSCVDYCILQVLLFIYVFIISNQITIFTNDRTNDDSVIASTENFCCMHACTVNLTL